MIDSKMGWGRGSGGRGMKTCRFRMKFITHRTSFAQGLSLSFDDRGVEYAGFGVSCHGPIRRLALGNIRFAQVRIWLQVIDRWNP